MPQPSELTVSKRYTTRIRPLLTVTICAVVAFLSYHLRYWFLGGSASNKLHFALFMSVVPALPVLIAMISRRLSLGIVVLIYVITFIVLALLQAGLR